MTTLHLAPEIAAARLADVHILKILQARTQGEMTQLKKAYGITWADFNAIRDQETPQARRVAEAHGIPDVAAMAQRVLAEMKSRGWR